MLYYRRIHNTKLVPRGLCAQTRSQYLFSSHLLDQENTLETRLFALNPSWTLSVKKVYPTILGRRQAFVLFRFNLMIDKLFLTVETRLGTKQKQNPKRKPGLNAHLRYFRQMNNRTGGFRGGPRGPRSPIFFFRSLNSWSPMLPECCKQHLQNLNFSKGDGGGGGGACVPPLSLSGYFGSAPEPQL